MKQYPILHANDFYEYAYDLGYSVLTEDQELREQKGRQLRDCQAWIIKAEMMDKKTGEVFQADVLQSYNTLVAFKLDGKTFRCGKYSRTTSRQTSWFERD